MAVGMQGEMGDRAAARKEDRNTRSKRPGWFSHAHDGKECSGVVDIEREVVG